MATRARLCHPMGIMHSAIESSRTITGFGSAHASVGCGHPGKSPLIDRALEAVLLVELGLQ